MDDTTIPGVAALRALNYICTPVLVGYYVVGTIYIWVQPQKDGVGLVVMSASKSRWKRIFLMKLSVLVMLVYAGKAVMEFRVGAEREDGLIHAIAQTLFWLAVALVLVGTDVLQVLVYAGTGVINLFFEVGIFVVDGLIDARNRRDLDSWGPLDMALLLALVAFAVVPLMFRLVRGEVNCSNEAQVLLDNEANRPNRATPRTNYGSRHLDDFDQHHSDESDSDSEGDNEKELEASRKKQLETAGWIGYLKTFKVLVPYVFPLRNRRLQLYLLLLFVNLAIERVLNVLYPRQLGIIVDRLTTERQVPWKDLMVWTVFAIIKSECCGVGAINEWLENRFTAWSRQELISASLNHVMNLSMGFHDQKDSGEVIKAIEQAASLNDLLQVLFLQFAPAVLDILVAMWYVTYLFDVYALFIIVAMMILFTFATYHITVIATGARRLQSRREREESKVIFESIGNWFTVSCFNRRDHMMSRLSHVITGTNAATLWSEDLFTYTFVIQELLEYIGRFGVSALAATRIVQGISSVGTLVTLESYWTTITNPLYTLSHRYKQVNTSLVDSERILQLFQEQSDVQDKHGAYPLQSIGGKVSFEDVCFAYGNRDTILNDLSFAAEAGQTVALVGETGAGKSTVFKLLMRFFDVTNGRITIDGQDIRDVKLDSLRECFGIVAQDSILFNMSIIENVRYGRLDATDEEIFAACKAALIHDKILGFANGYASKVGERGVKLSGGERQRIAIARVFLKNPQIILLDEATSAMDCQTESSVQDALKRLTRGRTTLVIAHRLSTVVEADQIFVMDKGQVVEHGTHSDLLRAQGRYFQLWSKQTSFSAPATDS